MSRRSVKPGLAAATRGTLRASLYVRLSKAADDDNTSKEGMIADLRALVAREGFTEVALHVDDGKSGGIRDRLEFLAWIADARQGRADVLVAWHVDRMTREGLNVAATMLDVHEGKDPTTGRHVSPPVRLMDCKGLDSDDGDGFRILFVIRAEIARAERERMRDRNRAKDERLRRAGRWPGGEPPYGYRVVDNSDGPGKVLVPAPGEADAVRMAAAQVLNGKPLLRVTRWMNEMGPRPRRAAAWTRMSLQQVLTGDAALGRVTHHGGPLRDEDGHALTPYPPVLTIAQVRALRQALTPCPDPRKRGRRAARLLSGLLACASCGAVLNVRHGPKIGYRCPTRATGRPCASPVRVVAGLIEEWAERLYLARFGHLEETERRLLADEAQDLAALDDAIAATVAEIAKAVTTEAVERLQKLQADRRTAASTAPSGPRVEEVLTGRTKAEEWALQDLDGRRDMLRRDLPVPLIILPSARPNGTRGFDVERVALDLDALPDPRSIGRAA